MAIYRILGLALGAALGALIGAGVKDSVAHACSCEDWASFTAMEVEGSDEAVEAWLRRTPPIRLRVAGELVITEDADPQGEMRIYPHETTSQGGVK